MADTLAPQEVDLDDDRPIALRRKRRSSSGAANANNAINSQQETSNLSHQNNDSSTHQPQSSTTNSTTTTPRKSKKRVRFSNPGTETTSSLSTTSSSTGLTPLIRRTSLATPQPGRLLSQKARRRHTTTPTSTTQDAEVQEIQFTPLRQILDERCKRRIRRNGLSEEVNDIEYEKREEGRKTKDLQTRLEEKDRQLAELNYELETERQLKIELGDSQESAGARQRVAELEMEVERLRGEMRERTVEGNGWADVNGDDGDLGLEEGDTIMIDDDGNDVVLVSTAHDDDAVPASPSKRPAAQSNDATTQASLADLNQEAEILALSLDLEAIRQEKHDLFAEWRKHFLSSSRSPSRSAPPSPPSNFLKQVANALKATKSRAEDAELALCVLETELKGLGFPGDDAEDVLAEIQLQFREARLELERTVPGETSVGFENAKVLSALLEQVKNLVGQVRDREHQIRGMHDRESVLRGQFDASLVRFERAGQKIKDLEDEIKSSAGDMLHTRTKVQALEKDINEKDRGIARLNAALDKYRDDVAGLENLITRLEEESTTRSRETRAEMDEAVADLECKVAAEEKGRRAAETEASHRGERIKELEASLEKVSHDSSEVQAQMESLKIQKEGVVMALNQKIDTANEKHQSDLGSLNARLAVLTTALADANAEIEKLKGVKDRLEQRVKDEIEQGQRSVEAIQGELMRSLAMVSETRKSYIRGAKVRYANSEIEEEESEGGSSAPLTPVSLVRFVDVEVGRGKNRRKYDSGIGVLSEDDEEEDGVVESMEE